MSTLYVIEPGSRLEKEHDRLLITRHDAVLLRVPLRRVSSIVLVGRVGMTTAAMHALLHADIPVLMVQRNGRVLGRLSPPTGLHVALRRQQWERIADERFSLELARAIVQGKLHNQRTLAMRLTRRHTAVDRAPVEALQMARIAAETAPDLHRLRGIEGQAARRYFQLYRQLFDPEWLFERRTRRPPGDPVNALLSLGYSLLTQAAVSALEVAGLDPYGGFLHAHKYGRPGLALDLVEEFRPPVVDSLVLSLINHRILQPKHFEAHGTDGTLLTDRGLRTFFRKFSQKLDSEFKPYGLNRRLSYRKVLDWQARRLRQVIEGSEPGYRAFYAR